MNTDEIISAAYAARPAEVPAITDELLQIIHTHFDANVVTRAEAALAVLRAATN
ncbi:MAG: hypothetical protein LCH82_02360 [Actinobacteria bacterium]|nr:hypothetical protein [Actinomycetota bacterium]